jgi:hypothetical protein
VEHSSDGSGTFKIVFTVYEFGNGTGHPDKEETAIIEIDLPKNGP